MQQTIRMFCAMTRYRLISKGSVIIYFRLQGISAMTLNGRFYRTATRIHFPGFRG